MATCIDVAKKAGVSRQTVSRVLNNSKNVSQKSRERVFKAIQELSYHPNTLARSLKSAKTKSIGFIIPDAKNVFYIEIANLLQNKLYRHDYSIVMLFSDENTFNEEKCIQYMIEKRVDLLLFTPTTKNEKLSKLINLYNLPSVQLFRDLYADLNAITVDDEYGAYIATKKLLKNGHTKIILIEGDYSFGSERLKGFTRALKEYGILYEDYMHVLLPRNTSIGDKDLAQQIKDKAVTGLIAVSKPIELRIVKLLKNEKLTLGKEISAVFYDDNDLADFLKITVIAHDLEKIADEIIEKVFQVLNEETSVFRKVITPYLIERDSVTNIRKKIPPTQT